VCQAGQVHKIRKQILPTCITLLTISKRKILENTEDQVIRKNKNFQNLPRNFHAKWQGGEG
jgi:hypothetical protein